MNSKQHTLSKAVLAELSSNSGALQILVNSKQAFETTLEKLRCMDSDEVLRINDVSLSTHSIVKLVEEARRGREFSHAPYSHFNVGSAILCRNKYGDEKVFNGCNVENASYGGTMCAERTAAQKAVSEGFKAFLAVAVVGGFDDSIPREQQEAAQSEYITPCGLCRQFLNEFDEGSCVVIVVRDTGDLLVTTIQALLPCSFGPKNLGTTAVGYDRHNPPA